MIRHKGISFDGAILAIIAGLLLQAIMFNIYGVNVAEVPAKVILVFWGRFAGVFGILADLTGF